MVSRIALSTSTERPINLVGKEKGTMSPAPMDDKTEHKERPQWGPAGARAGGGDKPRELPAAESQTAGSFSMQLTPTRGSAGEPDKHWHRRSPKQWHPAKARQSHSTDCWPR